MPSSISPEEDSRLQRRSAGIRFVLSDPLRVYLLILIEQDRRALTDLQKELPDDFSISDLKYHVETLREVGLVEVDEVRRVEGVTESLYKARLDAMLAEVHPVSRPLPTAKGVEPWTSSSGSVERVREMEVLLKHPTRRRLLRALGLQRVPSTITELMSYRGLSRAASSCLNYHARVLADAGVVEVVDELPVYRSLVRSDPTVSALLRDTAELDGEAPR